MIADGSNTEHENKFADIAGCAGPVCNERRAHRDGVQQVDPIETLLAHLEYVIQSDGDTNTRDVDRRGDITSANPQKERAQDEDMRDMEDLVAVHS